MKRITNKIDKLAALRARIGKAAEKNASEVR